MKILFETHQRVAAIVRDVLDELQQRTKPELRDILHECGDKLTTAKGSERVAIMIVRDACLAILEDEP